VNPFALPVHPAIVHFPIAMLTAAWVCLLGRYVVPKPEWDRYARGLELLGFLTMPVSIGAALIDTRGIDFLVHPRWDSPLIWHALVGVSATAVFGLHVLWTRRAPRDAIRPRFAVALADLGLVTVGLSLVFAAGLIAGEMVFAA
jgi:uncharacterized membrane protein